VKLRDFAERRFQRRWLQVATYALGYIVLMTLLELPWSFYTGFLREHQYHMSNLTTAGWFGEHLKGLIVGLILTTPVLLLLYSALRRWPTRWWSRAALVTTVLMLLLLVIAPVFISPVFNTYKPLPDSPLRDSILSLARANGIPADNVYEFDASRQTKRISANVSGALGSIRISLNDNLLKRSSPAEIRAVMGHEMGHYVLNHVYKLTIYHSLVFASGFAFTAWFFGVVLRRRGAAWGIRGIDDPAGLPILAAGLAVFFFLATPVSHSITRSTESEADIFGLNAAREPDGFSEAALQLSEYRKLAPGPWEEIVFFDHPSGYHRISMSMHWKAEHLAGPGK
jgi:STE24 endopeptidase